jgi:hypothetical protein
MQANLKVALLPDSEHWRAKDLEAGIALPKEVLTPEFSLLDSSKGRCTDDQPVPVGFVARRRHMADTLVFTSTTTAEMSPAYIYSRVSPMANIANPPTHSSFFNTLETLVPICRYGEEPFSTCQGDEFPF